MFFYLIILLATFTIYNSEGFFSDAKVLLTNFLIITISLVFMIYGDKYNYSTNKMLMLFSFFFFGIAPLLQYKYGIVLWGGNLFSENDYVRMNWLIVMILLIYQFFYWFFSKIPIIPSKRNKTSYNVILSYNRLILITLLSVFITLSINRFDIQNLFFRSGGDLGRIGLNSSIELIFSRFVSPFPVASLILLKVYNLNNKRTEIFLILSVLLTNFPTSNARFYIAAMYIPLILLYIKEISNKYLLLNKVVMLGLLIVFPFLDQARRISNFNDFEIALDFQMFLQGHFDSYQMFMRTVDANLIVGSKQLISALLFFIPRSVWPSKSIGSGALVANDINLSFDNISMNYFGEGYINFGYIGILLFILILALINSRSDKLFWSKNGNNTKMFQACYLLFLGLEFFILRGDLLSSFAYTVGILSSVFIVNLFAVKKNKKLIESKKYVTDYI